MSSKRTSREKKVYVVCKTAHGPKRANPNENLSQFILRVAENNMTV